MVSLSLNIDYLKFIIFKASMIKVNKINITRPILQNPQQNLMNYAVMCFKNLMAGMRLNVF